MMLGDYVVVVVDDVAADDEGEKNAWWNLHDGYGKVGYMTTGCYNITTWILRLGFNFNLRVFDSLEQFASSVAFPN